MHTEYSRFTVIFFILLHAHLGHGSVRCIVFTHRRVFERATVNTYSHMSRDCLYGSRAGNPNIDCFVQMKPFRSCPLLSGHWTVVLPSCHVRANWQSTAEMHVRTAIQLGRSGWTGLLPDLVAVPFDQERPVPPALLYLIKSLSMNTHSFVYILCFHVLRGDNQH